MNHHTAKALPLSDLTERGRLARNSVVFFVTVETHKPLEPLQTFLGMDVVRLITRGERELRGVVFTDESIDVVWERVWNTVWPSEPKRVSIAGPTTGKSWGERQSVTTAVVVDSERDGFGRASKEMDK